MSKLVQYVENNIIITQLIIIKNCYLKIDINCYKRNYEEAYIEACKRLEIIEKYINLELSSKDIEIKISKELNKSDRTVRRILKEYREVLQIVE